MANPKMATLVDPLHATTQDTTKWDPAANTGSPNFTTGGVVLPCPPGSTVGSGFQSLGKYDLTGSQTMLRVVNAGDFNRSYWRLTFGLANQGLTSNTWWVGWVLATGYMFAGYQNSASSGMTRSPAPSTTRRFTSTCGSASPAARSTGTVRPTADLDQRGLVPLGRLRHRRHPGAGVRHRSQHERRHRQPVGNSRQLRRRPSDCGQHRRQPGAGDRLGARADVHVRSERHSGQRARGRGDGQRASPVDHEHEGDRRLTGERVRECSGTDPANRQRRSTGERHWRRATPHGRNARPDRRRRQRRSGQRHERRPGDLRLRKCWDGLRVVRGLELVPGAQDAAHSGLLVGAGSRADRLAGPCRLRQCGRGARGRVADGHHQRPRQRRRTADPRRTLVSTRSGHVARGSPGHVGTGPRQGVRA